MTPAPHRSAGSCVVRRRPRIPTTVSRGVRHGVPHRLLHRLLCAADRVDDTAAARLVGDALETDGALTTWQRLCAPALATTAAGPPTARALALTTGIRQALDERLVRLARPGRHPTVMLATAPGEPGDLPLTALAAVLLEHGIESWRLGADVPWTALSAAVTNAAPALLVIWSGGLAHPSGLGYPSGLAHAAGLASLEARHPTVPIVPAGPGWPRAITLPAVASICLALSGPLPHAG